MPSIRVLGDRLRALWRPSRVRDEVDEELRFHVDMRAKANVAHGMTSADARREANRTFGRLAYVKELAYDVRGGGASSR